MNIFKDAGNIAADWVVKNAPTILTCVGAAGVILTAVASGKAAIKAKEVLDEMPEDTETKDKVKAVAPIIAKPAILACGTMWVIFSANKIALRRNAALVAAYTLTSRQFEEYEEKVKETIGKNKEKKIKEAIVEDRVAANPPSNELIENCESDKIICQDYRGRIFKVAPDTIDKAIIKLNQQLVDDKFVALNEWYQELGLSPVPDGESIGWAYDDQKDNPSDQLIELEPPWQQVCTLWQNKYPIRYIYFKVNPEQCYDDNGFAI